MVEPEEFDFADVEFLGESEQRVKANADPLSRIAEIDNRILYLQARNRGAGAGYEERENDKTIQELLEDRAKIISELSDEERENLEGKEKEESMENKGQAKRRVEIISHEQRLAEDPRGLTRVTIIGGYIFREVKVPKPTVEKSVESEEE